MNTHVDFVAIGDTVVDAFIRLTLADEIIDVQEHRDMLCMSFADKIPYEFVVVLPGVGNSPNASVSASRLGLSSALISNIGDDQNGKDCLKSYQDNKVSTEFIKTNVGMKTNYHYALWFHNERTILIKHEKFPYVMPDIGSPKWLYVSSLGETSLPFHADIAAFLEAHRETRLVFQPGTFQIAFGTDALKQIYEKTEIFFCNVEEARKILKTDEPDVKKLLTLMHDLGPKTVVITDGPKGAYASDGTQALFMSPYPDPKEPYERTGAGDAFASTFTSAIALGKTLEDALKWASINSMSVVQKVGAQEGLLGQNAIIEWLSKAPADWQSKKL
jgi:ribokinase